MSTTIRRNNLKAIRAMLESAVLITVYRDDGMDVTSDRVTAEQVMALAPRFSSVNTSHVTIYAGHFYTIYHTVEDAKRRLTDRAFEEYFGGAQS